jgi:DNA-directed RNA polymerase subunit omega
MELIKGFDSNYRYILVAARRARQLQSGANPMIQTTTTKACRIAEQEVHAQKVKWLIPPAPKSAVEVAEELLDKTAEDTDA